jgi:cytochrome c
MSSLEGNKIAAAILVGGMITLSVGILTDEFVYPKHHATEASQEGAAEGGGAAPAATPAPVEPVLGLIASADAGKGEQIAKKCQTCHSFDPAGTNKVGPGLYGVVGRMSGTHPGFAYSDAMKNHKKPWTFAELNKFIANPRGDIPGTKMTFPGLPKVQDRADLFAWLDKQAPNPAPLPTQDEIAAEQAALKAQQPEQGQAGGEAPEGGEQAQGGQAQGEQAQGEQTAAPAAEGAGQGGGDNAVAMIASADPAKGEKIAAKCKACHDLTKGGKNKIGPHLWGVVGREHASVPDFAYSDAMKKFAGKPWTFEDLDKFLTKPKDYAPGTKMSFPGLPKAEDRAALLRWLRDQSDSPVPLPQ